MILHRIIPHSSNCQVSRFYVFDTNSFASVKVNFVTLTIQFLSAQYYLGVGLSFAVKFAGVVLYCPATILFNVRQFLSTNFGFCPLFIFTDDVFPCFICAFIISDSGYLLP